MKKRMITLALAATLGISMMGCGNKETGTSASQEPSATQEPSASQESEVAAHFEKISENGEKAVNGFGISLFKECYSDKNTCISPMSIYVALAMTAEGADTDTLAEMEKTLGMSVAEMREYINKYMDTLDSTGNTKVKMANSIWTNESYVEKFKETLMSEISENYRAELIHEGFSSETADHINKWVEEHTDSLIKNIINEIPKDAVMYLINTITFDGVWAEQYEDNNIYDDLFHKEDGSTETQTFLHSYEGKYLASEDSTGFIKYYKDNRFAFVGILPEVGVSMKDYVAGLSDEKFATLINSASNDTVNVAIPEFESDYKSELQNYLKTLGMGNAFEKETADFNKFTEDDNSMYINRVIHQTHVEVNRKGTKAAAATIVEMKDECLAAPMEDYCVFLDRPFVYVILDVEQNLPLFIGTYEG